ncbi:MAG: UDP-glucose 4-epimerase GalE [Chloroflexi bacterium]|nr:UDP-glucose 4-epimerase GalE [Chloroflexota bacterium]
MRVLVTGGAGYIGSHVVAALGQAQHDAVTIDRRAQLVGVTPMDFVLGDIADAQLVQRVLREYEIDSIIHLAADKSAEESVREPGRYFANNVSGTIALLEAATRARVTRFIFSSSCAVYGVPDRLPVTEHSPLRPANPYGESKLLVERILPWYESAHGLRYASLRYFNAAGASLDGAMGESWVGAPNLIPVVLKAAYEGNPVMVFGTDYETPDGTAVRDYVHVVDLADAHIRALEYTAGSRPSVAVNLGTGRGWSVREVIDEARRVTGSTIAVRHEPRRPGDPSAIWADSSRAEQLLGWRARLGLRESLDTAWRWHMRFDVPPPAGLGLHPEA